MMSFFKLMVRKLSVNFNIKLILNNKKLYFEMILNMTENDLDSSQICPIRLKVNLKLRPNLT